MGKRDETETEHRHKTVTVDLEVYGELEALKKREQEELGLQDLSWNNFLARMARFYKEQKTKR